MCTYPFIKIYKNPYVGSCRFYIIYFIYTCIVFSSSVSEQKY